jgi:hypothetical protein
MYDLVEEERAFIERRLAQERQAMLPYPCINVVQVAGSGRMVGSLFP